MDQPFRNIVLSDDINRALAPIDCFIHRSGFSTRVARTGEEIIDLVRRLRPHAILMNYYLVGLKGDEVCRVIRRPESDHPPLAILLVGPTFPSDIEQRCREAGCDDYIGSPAAPNVLLQRLAGALGIRFRLHTRVPAVISISSGRIISEFLGYTKDVSEGGLLVETSLSLDPGRRLHVRLFLEQDRPLVTKATVVRVDRSREEDRYLLGLELQLADSTASHRLQDFIRSTADQ
jgi:CheY-like chemotaxis protein